VICQPVSEFWLDISFHSICEQFKLCCTSNQQESLWGLLQSSYPQQQHSQTAAMQSQLQLQQPLQNDTEPANAAWITSDEFRM
jgi:hypothetical protein